MKLLRQPSIERDGFTVANFPELRNAVFQACHAATYERLRPGENASNALARGVRWGVFANERFDWLARRTYSLSAALNPEEGGRVRRFELIDEEYLRRPEIETVLRATFAAWSFPEKTTERAYEVQCSAIRYEATLDRTAFPSPVAPHQDQIDGAIVLLHRTDCLIGGHSRLYDLTGSPLYEIPLEPGEALLIRDAALKHQVSPIQMEAGPSWRPGRQAYRDILIVRYQPLGR